VITQTFLILDRISYGKEQKIKEKGITDWQAFLEKDKIKGISKVNKTIYDVNLLDARRALFDGDSSYFIGKLPDKENWRLYSRFREEAVFLDIEVSGIERNSFPTVVGLSDGINTKQMITGINLDFRALKIELAKYKLIITFNGSSFDIPFLKKRYPDLIPRIPHVDVKHLCIKHRLSGGLKEIEKKLGIKRRNLIVEQLYNGDPFLLWRMYRGSGDEYYLKHLLEYNEEDVTNLKTIADRLLVN
jgi:uncharacterized protein YprB with RNaseH-like and TPR domain